MGEIPGWHQRPGAIAPTPFHVRSFPVKDSRSPRTLDTPTATNDGPQMSERPALAHATTADDSLFETEDGLEPEPHAPSTLSPRSAEVEGFVFGMLGILAFSFTLPLSRIASPQLGGLFVGIERAVIAAILAIAYLRIRREPWPERRLWRPIVLVAIGTVLGFGPLSSLAMQYLPAAHGVVVIGLLPAATAAMAVLRAGERPPRAFWLACAAGVVSVLIFAIAQG
ncbi:MAG: DMT family transporter, partial [Thermomicrobiales bacterium]